MLALCQVFFRERKETKVYMPSKLPQFVIRTDQLTLDKIKYIASKESRTGTQQIIYLIKKEIEKYESENGEIIIDR